MTLNKPSVLAFERKLDFSDALMFAGSWEERERSAIWEPVTLREKSVRGTISNRLKEKNPEQNSAKLDASIEKPNLQTVDVASLPAACDTLKLSFTLRVLEGLGRPSACNNVEYDKKLARIVDDYVKSKGLGELARRYAFNLANGRFLWRNRIGAEQVEVLVERLKNGNASDSWRFAALYFSLHNFDLPRTQDAAFAALAGCIEKGLSGTEHILLRVSAFVRLGSGQEVFPSQELILERGNQGKSKTLYQINGIAGIHSQKIGNAARCIDTWYPEGAEGGPIAVEPYGSVTTQGKAYRQPRDKMDFYTLLDGWVLKDKVPSPENQHFVMAVLIRGGVFGD
ncbi:MAG: type I-F CRISPR-associated protein Csy3 [Deltaproteobacteria bacterium]|jgi:CRISPR-associated protein Csy3|nr:type I-F CRISPR-associated protein Csy3 [Deltaproteobacteria bacterium]